MWSRSRHACWHCCDLNSNPTPRFPACPAHRLVCARYVGYFWAVLCSSPGPVGALPTPVSVQLRQVTVSGLPPGTADSCVLVVEARPSGSLAPRASRVCARSAPGALSGSLTGRRTALQPAG